MANKLYGYSPTYGGGAASPSSPAPTVSVSTTCSLYLGTTRYLPSYTGATADMYPHLSDVLRYSSYAAAADIDVGPPGVASKTSGAVEPASSSTSHLLSQANWPAAIAAATAAGGSSALDAVVAGLKRSTEVLYHPTVLGTHNTIGQSEAWYSTNALTKRPRYESASNFPIYPQRPGEKDCAYYMQTRTCKFGDSCKFDHPIWVPEGGIPNWKEVLPVVTSDSLPERPGEPDCPFFLKTQRCKFGSRCKFNHPKDNFASVGSSESGDVSALPERPSEPPCAFFMKTGICKFGSVCKFHHPKDIKVQLSGQPNGTGEQAQFITMMEGTLGDAKAISPFISYTPPLTHNSKGLPVRPGEVDCPFYMKTGSCKYAATCRYNHPDWSVINTPVAALGHSVLTPTAANLSIGIVNPAASLYQAIDPRMSSSMVGIGQTTYPQRPGQIECDYYMKTGECKYGERCKYHHPIDRSVKLTLAGLPRREGAAVCPYYLKTGTCKFGAACKFDHPPPAEVMEKVKLQGTGEPISANKLRRRKIWRLRATHLDFALALQQHSLRCCQTQIRKPKYARISSINGRTYPSTIEFLVLLCSTGSFVQENWSGRD
ncbi:hypothetical protein L6164_022930 [Bauhinia variegata]|uniref:Uncharacterized protein n=1 Tax=Bauhinia variegata TaxID=167791 RepID=A0ACB9MK25_BAUVA|nr:hypothetical protein L6164_022930 [Bauhinia variegata]